MADEDNKNNSTPKSDSSEENKAKPELSEWKKTETEILKDLNSNPKYIPFFEPYSAWSADTFKSIYAYRKATALLYGDYTQNKIEGYTIKYSNMAKEKLWEIQQRKLFDLQCRWRAELIKIPEVSLTYDFRVWSDKIEECPFLTPISQDEFDLYYSFIKDSTMEQIDSSWLQWQEYKNFKAQYLNNDEEDYWDDVPEWYEYYELKTGLGSLYLLSDIRGEKEEFYCNLWSEDVHREVKEKNKNKPQPKPDNRPQMSTDEEKINEFMNLFESAKVINLMNSRAAYDDIEDDTEFNEALETLKFAQEKIPIEFNEDWQTGIIETANKYIKKKLLEELPKAYDDYLFRINSGLGYRSEKDKKGHNFIKHYREMIIKGRELNGEPADLNF